MQLRRFFDWPIICNHPYIHNWIISTYIKSVDSYFVQSSSFNRFDFLQRTNSNGLTSSMTSSLHADLQTPSYASDMRVLMENMQALNVNHRQDDILLSSSGSLKDSGYQGKYLIDLIINSLFSNPNLLDMRSNSSRNYTPQTYRSNQSQSNATEASDVCSFFLYFHKSIFVYNKEYS